MTAKGRYLPVEITTRCPYCDHSGVRVHTRHLAVTCDSVLRAKLGEGKSDPVEDRSS